MEYVAFILAIVGYFLNGIEYDDGARVGSYLVWIVSNTMWIHLSTLVSMKLMFGVYIIFCIYNIYKTVKR